MFVDGVPRTYRDRKDIALQRAQFLKSKNPNSVRCMYLTLHARERFKCGHGCVSRSERCGSKR